MIQKLNQAAVSALADPALRKALNDQGVSPVGGSPQRMSQAIADDIALYRKIVKDANLKIE